MKEYRSLFTSMALVLLAIAIALPCTGADFGLQFVMRPDDPAPKLQNPKLPEELVSYFLSQIKTGDLKFVADFTPPQSEQNTAVSRVKYMQFFKGIPIVGSQVTLYLVDDSIVDVAGQYFKDVGAPTKPAIGAKTALAIAIQELDLEVQLEASELVIYPLSDKDLRLAWKLRLTGEGEWTCYVDAVNKKVLKNLTMINTDRVLTAAYNYRGNLRLMYATETAGDCLEMKDLQLHHAPFERTLWDARTGDVPVACPGSDGFAHDWDGDESVDAYWNVRAVDSYYRRQHGLEGPDPDRTDRAMLIRTHRTLLPDGEICHNNAFWDGSMLNFCEAYTFGGLHTAAALDVVGHEYSHAVIDFTADLEYEFESGALDEAFADIMGTMVERWAQRDGDGFDRRDWVIGEDAYGTYDTAGGNFLRSLENPHLKDQPAHLSEQAYLPIETDLGGVHQNATIFAHAFYLLANGGENPSTGIVVPASWMSEDLWAGFFLNAFTGLTSDADFTDAANAVVREAYFYCEGYHDPGDLFICPAWERAMLVMETIGFVRVPGGYGRAEP